MKTLTLLLENFTDFLLFIVKNKYKSLHTFNSQDIALRRQKRFNCLGREAVTPIRVQESCTLSYADLTETRGRC